jgi:hypothetical protein
MRFMVMVKGNKESEEGVMPSDEMLQGMAKYNEDLVKAGVMLAGEGLHPSSKGAKVKFSGGKVTVIDGPFTEAKELVAGYWIIEVKSKAEALEWVKRCQPFIDESKRKGGEGEVEIRQIFELSDFPQSEGLERHVQLQKELNEKQGRS